jgi:Tfp pilus assembly protein PilN
LKAPLNLARQPFRNERLPTLLLGLGTLALLIASVRQAQVAWQLMPGHARDVLGELSALEAESASLRQESEELRSLKAPEGALKEWAVVKGLVDRRAFPWTGLFAALEQALPPGVRLASVQPADSRSGATLSLAAVGRTSEDALALLKSLQAHGEFEGAFLGSWRESRDGVEISCTVTYVPRPGGRK